MRPSEHHGDQRSCEVRVHPIHRALVNFDTACRRGRASARCRSLMRRIVAVWFCWVGAGAAGADLSNLADPVARVERELDARVGVLVREVGGGQSWSHRAGERFLMNSTAKVLICAAVLDAAAANELDLGEALPVRPADLIAHAPLTEQRVGGFVSIDEACAAAIDLSDNTAANLLLERIGGPSAVTAFLRRSGDLTTRLDRTEPALNEWAAGDVRDTTTPEAMLTTLERMLLGEALRSDARVRLQAWMSTGTYTLAFVRAAAPEDWDVADKSGAGAFTRSYVALITPPRSNPWLAGIFLSGSDSDVAVRTAAVASIASAVVGALQAE